MSQGLRPVRSPPHTGQRAGLPTSGPSMAAGSVMVSMTSLTNSMGMSPITRSRLASSRVRFSGSFLFSPAGKVGRVSHGQQEVRGGVNEGQGSVPTWHGLSPSGIQTQGAVAAPTHGGAEDGGAGNNCRADRS